MFDGVLSVSVLVLLFFWCPCMAIIVSVQYNGELLLDIIDVCMITSKSMDQPGKVASPTRDQLNRRNEYFPVCVRA